MFAALIVSSLLAASPTRDRDSRRRGAAGGAAHRQRRRRHARRNADSHHRESRRVRCRRDETASGPRRRRRRGQRRSGRRRRQMVQDERAAVRQAAMDRQRAAGGELRAGRHAVPAALDHVPGAGSRRDRRTRSPAPIPSTGTPEGAPYESIGAADTIASLQKLMTAPRGRSPLHETLIARVERQPLAIARVLARRYPETPAISYIPALAWAQTLRLAAITNDESLREKVWRETRPWIAGEKPLFGDRVQLTAVAGTLIFAELRLGAHGACRPSGPRHGLSPIRASCSPPRRRRRRCRSTARAGRTTCSWRPPCSRDPVPGRGTNATSIWRRVC